MAALGIVCFVLILIGAQFFQWGLHLLGGVGWSLDMAALPLPVLMMAGVTLAIAANSRKTWGVFGLVEPRDRPLAPPPSPVTPASVAVAPPPPTPMPSPRTDPASTAATSVSYRIDPHHHQDERRPS